MKLLLKKKTPMIHFMIFKVLFFLYSITSTILLNLNTWTQKNRTPKMTENAKDTNINIVYHRYHRNLDILTLSIDK